VNIVIDAPGLAEEATDKAIVCEKMQNARDIVEKYEEGTKVSGRFFWESGGFISACKSKISQDISDKII